MVAVTVVMVTVVTVVANLEVIYVLARRGSRGSGIRRWLGRWLLGMGVMVVVVVAVMAAMTNVAGIFTTFRDGNSNDRCDGSSSKNECNGEFDLNHF